MAEYLIQGETLTKIADAIRAKTGGTDPINFGEIETEIGNIQVGGGGLPEGISALATGTITPTSNITADYTITHDLGKKPDFAILMLCEDASTTALKSTQTFQLLGHKPFISGGTVYYGRGIVVYQNSSGTATNTIVNISDSSFATATTVKFRALSTYPLKAGYTYRWIAGALSDIV